jgi:hypothetical protein
VSVCLNHTDRPASQRCKSCLRPICEQCVVQAEDGIYCSNRCVQDTKKYSERMAALGIEKPPPSLWDFLRGPVVFLSLVAFLIFGAWVMSPSMAPAPVAKWINAHVYPPPPKPAKSAKPKDDQGP